MHTSPSRTPARAGRLAAKLETQVLYIWGSVLRAGATVSCWIVTHADDALFVAALQLGVGLIAAYVLTERWQRWRQRRDFQYQTMFKLSETSMELFVLLAELLSIHPQRQNMADVWDDRQRRYISQRVVFHALEAGIMASFRTAAIAAGYHALNGTLKTLFAFVQYTGDIHSDTYEPVQDKLLKQRKLLLGQMIAEMRLVSWRERCLLRRQEKTQSGTAPTTGGPPDA